MIYKNIVFMLFGYFALTDRCLGLFSCFVSYRPSRNIATVRVKFEKHFGKTSNGLVRLD